MTESLPLPRPSPWRSAPHEDTATPPVGRLPRVARLMALAIRMNHLLQAGHVADYAELARLGHVSRARISQIMNLLLLAPTIQEEILFLGPNQRGRDATILKDLQPLALTPCWQKQRQMWQALRKGKSQPRANSAQPDRAKLKL